MSAKSGAEAKEHDEKESRYEGPIICNGHSRPVVDLAFSKPTPDGDFLASSCLDGKPMIREGSTGDWVGTLIGHKGAVWCCRLNATATQAVTGSADFSAKLWDSVTGDEVQSFPEKHIVRATIFSEDSRRIFTGGIEKKLRLYDLQKPNDPQIFDKVGAITHIALSASPDLVLTACKDEAAVRVWDLRSGKSEQELKHSTAVSHLQLSMDGTVLSSSAGSQVHFWDAKSLKQLNTYKLPRAVECVAFHPSAGIFVTGGQNLWAHAYDYKTGEEIVVNKGHHGPVRCLSFNPQGDVYATGSEDGTIRLWEWAKEKQVQGK